MRVQIHEVPATAVATAVVALAAFVALRAAFPDPAIEGSHCPGSLGEPAYSECIRSWHTSHAERDMHRLATGLGVVLLTGVALVATERTGRMPRVRPSLALVMAAAFAAPTAVVLAVSGERSGLALLAGAGLFALAAVWRGEPLGWWPSAAAVGIGAASWLAVWVTYFTVFWEGS